MTNSVSSSNVFQWDESSYGLFPADPAVASNILSFTGPSAGFAGASKALNSLYKGAMSVSARVLARTVDRDLWNDPRLLPVTAILTNEQEIQLQQAALEKVRDTWQRLSSGERDMFGGRSLQEISSNPALFSEILRIADEEDLVQMMEGSLSLEKMAASREEKVSSLADELLFTAGESPLSRVPKAVYKLGQLRILNLSNKQLTKLPDSFCDLHNLTHLLLDGNQLTILPALFGNLHSLTHLLLDGNNLTELPASFGELCKVQEIFLNGNQLKELPASFGNLYSLRELYLHNNQLETLPDSVGNLGNLIKFKLMGNQLRTLPESFKKLTALEYLDLRGNPLEPSPNLCRMLAEFCKRKCRVFCDPLLKEGIIREMAAGAQGSSCEMDVCK